MVNPPEEVSGDETRDDLEIVRTKKPSIRKVIEILAMATMLVAMILSGFVVAEKYGYKATPIGYGIILIFTSIGVYVFYQYFKLSTQVVPTEEDPILEEDET